MYKLFKFLVKRLKLMIYSTLWASDMEIQNVWFVIIPICSIRKKKKTAFFKLQICPVDQGSNRSDGRIPHKKRIISIERY